MARWIEGGKEGGEGGKEGRGGFILPLTLVKVRWRLSQVPFENWSFFAPSNNHRRNTVIISATRSANHSSGSKGVKAFKRST